MSNEAKTVRVRVAVAVSDLGDWRAHGLNALSDARALEVCGAYYLAGNGAVAVHFIEADLPLPSPVTVEAEVKP